VKRFALLTLVLVIGLSAALGEKAPANLRLLIVPNTSQARSLNLKRWMAAYNMINRAINGRLPTARPSGNRSSVGRSFADSPKSISWIERNDADIARRSFRHRPGTDLFRLVTV
jgi:hypothetical protein